MQWGAMEGAGGARRARIGSQALCGLRLRRGHGAREHRRGLGFGERPQGTDRCRELTRENRGNYLQRPGFPWHKTRVFACEHYMNTSCFMG